MLDNLTLTAEQVKHAEPISAHPDKLKEQIEENKVIDQWGCCTWMKTRIQIPEIVLTERRIKGKIFLVPWMGEGPTSTPCRGVVNWLDSDSFLFFVWCSVYLVPCLTGITLSSVFIYFRERVWVWVCVCEREREREQRERDNEYFTPANITDSQ